MNTTEKKPLFELTAPELEEELMDMFRTLNTSHPIRCEVAAALLAAEAATQKLSLEAFDEVCKRGGDSEPFEAFGTVFEAVESLNGFLLDGAQQSRLDLVLWDAAGYVHGWFVDQSGRLDVQFGSCPEVVAKLAATLRDLAQLEQEWRAPLERRAMNLALLVQLSREKAELRARARVESQSWLRKLISPTTLERELLSLGFR